MNIVYHVPMSTSEGTPAAATGAGKRGAKPKNEKKVTFLTQRIDHLFDTVHPKGRKPYSFQEVADAILDAAGLDPDGKAPISASYIWQLRTGVRANPTRRHIALLAAFFDVSPLYFFEGEYDLGVDEMELARILRDPRVYALTRAAVGLSDTSLDTVTALAASLHTIEQEARNGHKVAD